MNPNNWYEVYILYHAYIISICLPEQADAIWNTFKTALLRFVLHELGFVRNAPNAKMTKAEVQAAEEFLKTLPMRSLLSLRTVMADALETLGASQSSRNTYTSRIKQFISWGEQQSWWPNNRGKKNGAFRNQCCPQRRSAPKLAPPKLISGKGKTILYGLKEKQLLEALRLRIRQLKAFLTEPNHPQRCFKKVEQSTAKGYLKDILLMFGWFHHYHEPSVPIDELSLDLIFPVFDPAFLNAMTAQEQEQFWREQKARLKTWLCAYRTFLQAVQGSFSPCTWLGKLEAVYAVAREQWSSYVQHQDDYQTIPLMRQLREELDDVQEELDEWEESSRYAADQSQKWPDVPEGKTALEVILETVVEHLRCNCKPLTAVRTRLRSPHKLAVCHARFLAWAEHTIIPAHRQQVSREEQVAESCPIERPKDVPIDGLYQPLPPDIVLPKRGNGTVKANFLCRLYSYKGKTYPGGVWIRIIRDYKTWKTHGDQEYVIPNKIFADGSCLYDYIEQYLYGYWLSGSYKGSQVYTWGQPELDGQQGKWVSSGRMELNPIGSCAVNPVDGVHWTWGNVYVMPMKGLPYSDADFSSFFAQGSLTSIEKWITPHILRSVWATWGYEQGLSDAELRSLAYAMGMTLETLYKTYQRCTPETKRKAIEQVIEERMLDADSGEVMSVERLIRLARQLNLADRQKLVAALLDTSA